MGSVVGFRAIQKFGIEHQAFPGGGSGRGMSWGSFNDLQVYVQMPDHSNRLVEARNVGMDGWMTWTCQEWLAAILFFIRNLGENILQDDKTWEKNKEKTIRFFDKNLKSVKHVLDLSQNSIDDQAVILFRSKYMTRHMHMLHVCSISFSILQ